MTVVIKEKVLSVDTDVIHLNESVSGVMSSSVEVIFIPGNPGTIEFYEEFLFSLWEMMKNIKSLDHAVNIHSVGHANHHMEPNECLRLDYNYPSYGLEYQIEHKIAFISNVINHSQAKEKKVILIGHSIGCYMILSAMRKSLFVKEATVEVILLMPFILWKNVPIQHKLLLNTFVTLRPFSIHAVHALGHKFISLPSKIKYGIAKAATGLRGKMLDRVAYELFSIRLVTNFFEMGKDEILSVPRDENIMMEFLSELDSKCFPFCVVYTNDDKWAPSEDVHRLKSRLRANRDNVMYCHGVTHGFTLHDKGNNEILNTLVRYFSKREHYGRSKWEIGLPTRKLQVL